MDNRFGIRTRNSVQHLAPGTWWTVDDVALGGRGRALCYQLGSHEGQPADAHDGRGRTVLESFASLPLPAMRKELDDYGRSLRGVADAVWDPERARAIMAPLEEFVRIFGPIGVGWGGEFEVSNPEIRRLQRALERAQWRLSGRDPATFKPAPVIGSPFWTVDFWGHAPGRGAVPAVRRRRWFPDLPWSERVRLNDDGLPHDVLHQIVDEYTDLHRTIRLVDAVAREDQGGSRRAVQSFVSNDDAEFLVDPARMSRPDCGRAFRGVRPASGRAKLFRRPAHEVDWVVWGRCFLADLIGRQIDFAIPSVDITAEGLGEECLAIRWHATSVLEVIYLQLLDHVRRHPDFGVGWCGSCKGPILRTRRPGTTGNQWHPGCRSGRVAKWRLANPDWRLRRSDAPRVVAR